MQPNTELRRRDRRGMIRAAATVAAAVAALPLLATAGGAQIGSHWFEPPKPNPPAAPRRLYRLTDLGAPPARANVGEVGSRGGALNERGQAVCVTEDYAGRAFVAALGVAPREIESLPGLPRLRPTAINERGEVVGTAHSEDLQERRRAFVWKAGTTTELPTPEGEHSEGLGINDRGEVVGTSYALRPRGDGKMERYAARTFLWSQIAGFRDLDRDAGTGHRLSINNLGQIAGASGVIGARELQEAGRGRPQPDMDGMIPPGAYITRGPEKKVISLRVPDSWGSSATDINDNGQVVGTRYLFQLPTVRETRVFVWADGRAVDLDGMTSFLVATPRINNWGAVVCSVPARDPAAAEPTVRRRPVLYEGGARLWLDGCLEPTTVKAGWRLVEANDINDRGQVLGTAVRDGRSRAVLLTPLP